ncbi:MAG: membrane protein insertase YidC [Candidatus Kerfeldbacteria bacterium]|nr:membrane protein insertase YidC [Candidatus Kerfeldbacteria bacterium]
MLTTIYHTVLYEPLLNALIFLYHYLGKDLGFAIILLTILIKGILFYPSISQLRSQRKLQESQGKLKELKEKYKNDKEGYSRAVLDFYKQNKVNPLSSCLPLVLQLIILIPLYRVFIAGIITDQSTGLMTANQLAFLYGPLRDIYSTIPIHAISFGIVDVTKSHNIILAVLAAAATLWQSRMLIVKRPPQAAGAGAKDEGQAASINKSMMYLTPLFTLYFAYQFPAGLALYWLASTLFQVGQQWYFLRRHPHPPAAT